MKVSEVLVNEFARYYTTDELPANSSPDADAILKNWAENSVYSLAKRAQGHLEDLVDLIGELVRDRKHPLFSEINDATLMAWNGEDDDWRIAQGLLTYMRIGLVEVAAVNDPSAREAILTDYRAYQCDEGERRWYAIDRVSTQTSVVHVRRIASQDRKLTIEYELTSNDLTHTLARLLIDRVLLGGFLGNRCAATIDHVEYVGDYGVACVLPIDHGQKASKLNS